MQNYFFVSNTNGCKVLIRGIVQDEIVERGHGVSCSDFACINRIVSEIPIRDVSVFIANQSIGLYGLGVELHLDFDVFRNDLEGSREILSKDIETAKLCGAKYILITLGSMKDSFKPNGKPEAIARELINFLSIYNFNGINFADSIDISTD